MKKKLVFLALLFVMTVAMSSTHSFAKTYEEKGFKYFVSDKEAVITDTLNKGDTLVIPSTLGGFPVKHIYMYAFYNKKMSKVSLPSSIETIGSQAFYNCSNLKEITLPTNVKEIEYEAFYGCSSLASVKFNQKLTEISSMAFSNCISLRKVELPKEVRKIGREAFASALLPFCIQRETAGGTLGCRTNLLGALPQTPQGISSLDPPRFARIKESGIAARTAIPLSINTLCPLSPESACRPT